MSHSYAYKVDPASLMTLCPVCLHAFQDAKKAFLRRADVHQQTKDICTYCQSRYGFDYKAFLRRADVHQQTKDICTYCQSRYGFDYYVQPAAAHRDTTHRKVRTYVPASNH